MMDFQRFWAKRGGLNYLLLPLSAVFAGGVGLRRWAYRSGLIKSTPLSVPVVVVGNIVVGGGGKTPLTIALVQFLQEKGWTPGVVARGYGGRGGKTAGALMVDKTVSWQQCGDEPFLIWQKTQASVCVGRDRVAAAQVLIQQGCNIIVSDDGLQHYALRRDVELCVRYAEYGQGNGWLLPAGPLRESVGRLKQCDRVVQFDHHLTDNSPQSLALFSRGFYPLGRGADNRYLTADFFAGKKAAAVTGIAQPRRFFDVLERLGIKVEEYHALADHKKMPDDVIKWIQADCILMTEKDAIKYDADLDERIFVLDSHCLLPDDLKTTLTAKLPGP